MKKVSKGLLYFLIFLPILIQGVTIIFFSKNFPNPAADTIILVMYFGYWIYSASCLWDDKKFQSFFGPKITHGQAMAGVFVGLIIILIYAFYFFALHISPEILR